MVRINQLHVYSVHRYHSFAFCNFSMFINTPGFKRHPLINMKKNTFETPPLTCQGSIHCKLNNKSRRRFCIAEDTKVPG